VAHGRPDLHPAPVGDVVQITEAIDIDEMGRSGQAEGQQRDETLASGQNLGFVAPLGEQADSLLHRLGQVVFEWRQLQGALRGRLFRATTPPP
jgi:hypothetical protein